MHRDYCKILFFTLCLSFFVGCNTGPGHRIIKLQSSFSDNVKQDACSIVVLFKAPWKEEILTKVHSSLTIDLLKALDGKQVRYQYGPGIALITPLAENYELNVEVYYRFKASHWTPVVMNDYSKLKFNCEKGDMYLAYYESMPVFDKNNILLTSSDERRLEIKSKLVEISNNIKSDIYAIFENKSYVDYSKLVDYVESKGSSSKNYVIPKEKNK